MTLTHILSFSPRIYIWSHPNSTTILFPRTRFSKPRRTAHSSGSRGRLQGFSRLFRSVSSTSSTRFAWSSMDRSMFHQQQFSFLWRLITSKKLQTLSRCKSSSSRTRRTLLKRCKISSKVFGRRTSMLWRRVWRPYKPRIECGRLLNLPTGRSLVVSMIPRRIINLLINELNIAKKLRINSDNSPNRSKHKSEQGPRREGIRFEEDLWRV